MYVRRRLESNVTQVGKENAPLHSSDVFILVAGALRCVPQPLPASKLTLTVTRKVSLYEQPVGLRPRHFSRLTAATSQKLSKEASLTNDKV